MMRRNTKAKQMSEKVVFSLVIRNIDGRANVDLNGTLDIHFDASTAEWVVTCEANPKEMGHDASLNGAVINYIQNQLGILPVDGV
jgi:hypothetical protein